MNKPCAFLYFILLSAVQIAAADSTISLTTDDATVSYPVTLCHRMQNTAIIQGKESDSGIAFQMDATGIQVGFTHAFETEEGKFVEQWGARQLEPSIDGDTITVAGTLSSSGRWRVLESGMREAVKGEGSAEKPFTLIATCSS